MFCSVLGVWGGSCVCFYTLAARYHFQDLVTKKQRSSPLNTPQEAHVYYNCCQLFPGFPPRVRFDGDKSFTTGESRLAQTARTLALAHTGALPKVKKIRALVANMYM